MAVLVKYGRHDKGFHHVFTYETFLIARSNERFQVRHEPKGDQFRILILGGSTADQLWGMPKDLYSELFGKLTTKRLEVLNFAQAGSITSQELIMLARYGLRIEPDLVIAIDGVNDIVTVSKGSPPGVPYTDAYVQLAMNKPFLNAIVSVASTFTVRQRAQKARRTAEEKALQANAQSVDLAISEYLANHAAMASIANGVGARFVSVLQPYIHLRQVNTPSEKALRTMANYAYRKEFMTDALSKLRGELVRQKRAANASFVDSIPVCDGSTDDCFVDEAHLTGRGKTLLLTLIADGLLKQRVMAPTVPVAASNSSGADRPRPGGTVDSPTGRPGG